MAAAIGSFIDRIQIGSDEAHQIAIGSSAYGVCDTAADNAAKTVSIPGFSLKTGTTIHVKFTNSNSASNPTLSVSGSTAAAIAQYGSIPASTDDATSGWQSGAILTLTYDGTRWIRDQGYNTSTWTALSTSEAGYVAQAPNDTTKFLRGDATWSVLPAATDSVAGITIVGDSGGAAAYSHIHGNLTSDGKITTAITLAQNDYLIVGDSSASGKIGKGPIFSASISTQATDTKFLREDGSWSAPTFPVTSVATLTGAITAANLISQLGLSTAMHFRGISTVTITEGSQTNPTISGYTFGTNGANALAGDVIIDKDSQYEYVWTGDGADGVWEKLGDYEAYSISDHTHGNLTNDGKITSTATIANGDRLVIVDSDSTADSKITGTSITFDGSTETQALTKKGTWATFNNYTHPTGDGNSHVPATDTDKEGFYLRAGSSENSATWAAPTVWHGTCATTGSTAIKEVVCPSFPKGNNLTAGTVIFVYFDNTNSAAVGNIKLRVNSSTSSDAKPIKYLYNNEDPANLPDKNYLVGGQTYYFTYDGTNWVVRLHYDTNTQAYGIRVYRDTVSVSAFNDDYPLLISRSLSSDIDSAYSEEIYATINNSDETKIPTYNPYTGMLTAPNFVGNLTGTADVALKLTTSNLGSATQPIYLVSGVATECSVYAGGTKVTLNDVNKGTTTADFYAAEDVGERYQILVSGGSTNKIPVWTAAATLQSEVSTTANENPHKYTTLTLGNEVNITSTSEHSEGRIILYSAATAAHIINGASTTTDYTHTLPNDTGWIAVGGSADGSPTGVADGTTLMYLANTGILTASTADVGSATQSVYLDDGVITAIQYTANKLYYSTSTTSFEAGTYYADGTGLAINKNSLTSGYIFEVNGKTSLLNDLDMSANIIPTTTNSYTLGTPNTATAGQSDNAKRWEALYVGTADTYGDPYLPIYWDGGVPTYLNGVVQYIEFTIDPDDSTTSVILESAAFNQLYGINTYVMQIVVTDGIQYLKTPLTWTTSQKNGSATTGVITISTNSAVEGEVSGYIVVARGDAPAVTTVAQTVS